MKKLLSIALVLLLAAAVINDIARYFTTAYGLGQTTTDLVRMASERAQQGGNQATVGAELANAGIQRGVEVTAYGQAPGQVTVYTRAKVEGTWVFARAANLIQGKPMETPYYVTDSENRFLQ